MKQASVRIDVGGKLLTNLLCETISQKEFNLQGEFALVNDIKEKGSFLALNQEEFNQNLEICHQSKPKYNSILREYVLPDYKKIMKGYIREKSSGNLANVPQQDEDDGA